MPQEAAQFPNFEPIIHYLAGLFGGEPEVSFMTPGGEDDTGINVLTCARTPDDDLNCYATVDLSEYVTLGGEEGEPPGLELVAICNRSAPDFLNIFAGCAIDAVQRGGQLFTGDVLLDIFKFSDLTTTMSHMFLIPPITWQGLERLALEDDVIEFLWAVPISESERLCWQYEGAPVLFEKLVAANFDPTDLNRQPVV